ncbi:MULTISPECIES: spore coat U domain-containing protein [unclassified Acinetobacter]|uniref:Csu type fimbrial protein n=1 Tax=unclassified Acinetobacter TaxID=196816 RepID=UPI0029343059|nr:MULTISPECIES: spore coat U domain-containing protein [unclassified Acinetobacter]WOE33220.1 spore coat U domain-containing protein [Acinetobacter sp. SAAs470]WOE36999.1 spore coat U domain-containing protein [Acinetobacter sp. SAAs474]
MKLIKYAFVVLAVVLVSTYTMSNRDSSQFQVKIQIKETCDIGTGSSSDMDFGTIERSTQNVQASANLNVYCTQGTPYHIALNSEGVLKNINNNTLKLPYRLYQDQSMTREWGNIPAHYYSQHGTGQTQNITIWGKVPDTNVPAGHYSDQVTATITY